MYPWHDDGGALRLLVGNFIYERVTMALAHDDKGTIFNYGNSNRSHTHNQPLEICYWLLTWTYPAERD